MTNCSDCTFHIVLNIALGVILLLNFIWLICKSRNSRSGRLGSYIGEPSGKQKGASVKVAVESSDESRNDSNVAHPKHSGKKEKKEMPEELTFKEAPRRPSGKFFGHSWKKHEDDAERYDWEIEFTEIKLLKKIGSGSFGTVHKAMWMDTVVAVKMPANDLSDEALNRFLREVRVMTGLHHPNIVDFLGACITKPNICLVMEFLSAGCVYDYLRNGGVIRFDRILKFAVDVARGMQYLHRRCDIIQRDLKTTNLLLDEFFNVKVCDFGLSRVLNDNGAGKAALQAMEQDPNMTVCGTPFWTAPEVIRSEKYNHKADVFSYGIVLVELVSRKNPYAEIIKPALEIAYLVAHKGLRPQVPATCPNNFKELINSCLAEAPKDRPNFGSVVQKLFEIKKHYKEEKLEEEKLEASKRSGIGNRIRRASIGLAEKLTGLAAKS